MEAAFFDLDKTVIAQASMVAFGRPLYREGLIGRRHVVRALYGHVVYMHLGASEQKLARIRESVLRLTRGWQQERIRNLVRESLEEVVEPLVYAEAAELIAHHRAAGRRVLIVSAAPEEIVAPLAEYLGADGAIASQAKVDEEGRYTGEMDFYAYGPFKEAAMRAIAARDGIDLAASYAYSDSYTDAPMLAAVGHPVAVNPDRVLLKLARERGWTVRHFSHPVPLRTRLARSPSPGPTAAMAGAAVLASAFGGYAWRRLRRPPGTGASAGAALPAQSSRSFRAATLPRTMRIPSSSSFFMDADGSADGQAAH